jgi:uncharacterized membrane protein
MAFCSGCGTQVADGSTMCPACSAKSPGASAPVSSGAMADNVAGMLAYVTIIPAIIFLVTAPYNRNRFVRFHAFQCIYFAVAMFAIWAVLLVVGFIPLVGLLMIPVHLLIWLGSLIVWILLLVKTNQGLKWKLPIIGDMAEKQANA